MLATIVLLLSYGAVGARQPAVRSSAPLPAPAAQLAAQFNLSTTDRSRIVLDIVRLVFDSPDAADHGDAELRRQLNTLLAAGTPGEAAPLPLDPSIWRDTLLQSNVPDAQILTAVLSNRRTALLYYGLSALDDETLGWLGPDRALLTDLGEHAGTFAAFSRSLRVQAGRVVVPGGAAANRVWEEIVGAPVSQPSAFARRLFSRQNGQLAFLYDTIAHLDGPRMLFALSGNRVDRVRALAQLFERTAIELRPDERPFARQYMDPSLLLMAITVTPEGNPVGPSGRGVWELVFRNDERADQDFRPAALEDSLDATPIDAAWIASRIHRSSAAAVRRRLDTFLFAQRVFADLPRSDTAEVITALRGMLAFPALALTLERLGVRSPAVFAAAAQRADTLNAIEDASVRRTALAQFQSALGILERAVHTGGLTAQAAAVPVSTLLAIDFGDSSASERFATWIADSFVPTMDGNADPTSVEAAVLGRMAGKAGERSPVIVQWEGRSYRVSHADAELVRLRQVRQRQGGPSLDEVLAKRSADARAARRNGDGLAQVLTSILYAAYLGEPDGSALSAGNVALRHDLGFQTPSQNPLTPWRPASESFRGPGGWTLTGSLLGLDVPLARFALKRLDTSVMPPPPKLTSNERHIAALTAALIQPHRLTDAARDEIAGALARGRARLAALTADRDEVDRFARDAGISEWRREALAWSLTHDRDRVAEQISPLELFWVGSPPRADFSRLDAWGSAAWPVNGCICVEMPTPLPWDLVSGRPAAGMLGAKGADVMLVIAEELARMHLPASLAGSVLAFAMQDAIDATQPAYFDDWSQFGRAAQGLSHERIVDYVAALAAGGPLLPVSSDSSRH
jgi:hypothetical protein